MKIRTVVPARLAGLILLTLALVTGCDGRHRGSGRLGFLLTDQGGAFEQVLVTVAGVRIYSPDTGWLEALAQETVDAIMTQPIDLVPLRDREAFIGLGEVPEAQYTQLALLLYPRGEVVLPGGEHHTLHISGDDNLTPVVFAVPDEGITYLVIDIDTDLISPSGASPGDYTLPPQAVSVASYAGALGAISGMLHIGGPFGTEQIGGVVTAYWDETDVAVASDNLDSRDRFLIENLLPGQYHLVAQVDVWLGDSVTDTVEVDLGMWEVVGGQTLQLTEKRIADVTRSE